MGGRMQAELKEELRARDRDEARHRKEVEEIKQLSSMQVQDIDQKFRGMKQEYESTLSAAEGRYREAVGREKSKLDGILNENDQLRKIIGEGRSLGVGGYPML